MLFNTAYSFFLSFIVIKNALYNIMIDKIEKINNIIAIIISKICVKFSLTRHIGTLSAYSFASIDTSISP